MQVIMYDVTNEFRFHYDENCSTGINSDLLELEIELIHYKLATTTISLAHLPT